MVTCSQCGAEYTRKPSKCGCGYRFAAEEAPQKPPRDPHCRYAVGADRCPGQNGGDGYCDWHSAKVGNGASVMNYLRAHGVPLAPPDWREVFILACYAGMQLKEIQIFDAKLRRDYLSIPVSLRDTRESYEREIARIETWRRSMNQGQQVRAA